ncbi:hypothetical protein ACT6CD_08775 [Campylobacter coli]|uniref:hypothetical protein n=1 Tax=Campylobacter coli TaxID=195 RepID=UPI0040346840
MDKIKVTLKNYTPLDIAIDAIRTCWDSGCKKDSYYENGNYIIGNQDRALLNRIIHQHKHHSTVEHLCILAEIFNINEHYYNILSNNPFINISKLERSILCSYNFRTLINLEVDLDFKLKMMPKEYIGIFKGDKNESDSKT